MRIIKRTHLLLLSVLFALKGYPAAPKNIIFILADDQRADVLGCYGNDLIQTHPVEIEGRIIEALNENGQTILVLAGRQKVAASDVLGLIEPEAEPTL